MSGIVLALGSTALAEPISVVYRIDVFQRCEYTGNTQSCGSYTASFPLTLRFDSGVTAGHGDESDRTQFYGPPVLSDIPLPRRTDFPPTTENLRQAAERAQRFSPGGPFVRHSNVLVRHRGSRDGSDYHQDVSLLASGEFSSMPDLTAASFARFLGTAPSRQFSVSDAIELSSGGFEALTYYGNVSLEAAPVPEPLSMLLVGSGLAGIVFRCRR